MAGHCAHFQALNITTGRLKVPRNWNKDVLIVTWVAHTLVSSWFHPIVKHILRVCTACVPNNYKPVLRISRTHTSAEFADFLKLGLRHFRTQFFFSVANFIVNVLLSCSIFLRVVFFPLHSRTQVCIHLFFKSRRLFFIWYCMILTEV